MLRTSAATSQWPSGQHPSRSGQGALALAREGPRRLTAWHIRLMHTVAVLALPDVIAFDLATPIEVFGRARLPDGRGAYRVVVCGAAPTVAAGPLRISVDSGLDETLRADTIIVPGRNDITWPTPTPILDTLRAAAAAGTRIASICVGAFTLAEAGLLDGRRATTHWLAADAFAARFPKVQVDPDVLYVDGGDVLTSAGAAAGLDLCLHLVRRDHGVAVAADASRLAVSPATHRATPPRPSRRCSPGSSATPTATSR
jgi:transcriptional regulator GlxA family with amidase domain